MHPYAEFVANLAKPFPTKLERLRHAALGIIGEVGEIADCWKKHSIYDQPLNVENMVEELGDLKFYIQMVENEGYSFGDAGIDVSLIAQDSTMWIIKLNKASGQLCDLLDEGSKSEIDFALVELITAFLSLTVSIPALREVQMGTICEANMTKLRKRYPNGYTNQNAKDRVDKLDAREN